MSSSRWRRAGSSPSTAVDDKSDEEEVNQMTTVESVVTEIGLTHPIVSDIYDLCDYVKEEILNYFTVSLLKEICSFFELPFKWESCRGMYGAKATQKIRSRGRALFSRPFACICTYNVTSVVHQKIGLLIKLFVVVV